jgi:pyruvate-ferredoxin/flavodoxin oxidoreductase
MKTKDFETIDGNEAAARVAYQLNEVIAINPITPASSNEGFESLSAEALQRKLEGTLNEVRTLQKRMSDRLQDL